MKIEKLYLKRNDKAVEEIKNTGDTKKPYFQLSIPPAHEGGEWIEIGAFWKAKNGTGYNFKAKEGVALEMRELTSDNTVVPFED